MSGGIPILHKLLDKTDDLYYDDIVTESGIR
jgi:hypothetical protein